MIPDLINHWTGVYKNNPGVTEEYSNLRVYASVIKDLQTLFHPDESDISEKITAEMVDKFLIPSVSKVLNGLRGVYGNSQKGVAKSISLIRNILVKLSLSKNLEIKINEGDDSNYSNFYEQRGQALQNVGQLLDDTFLELERYFDKQSYENHCLKDLDSKIF